MKSASPRRLSIELAAVFAAATVCVAAVAPAIPARAAEHGDKPGITEPQSAPIPAQELATALQAFGRAYSLHIVFVSEDLAKLRSSDVPGGVAAADALQALLRGTGLTFEFLDAGTVSILPLQHAAGASTVRAAAPRRNAVFGNAANAAALDELTVTADRYPLGEALKTKTFQFVNSHSVLGGPSAHLSRWYRPICARTTGLSKEFNAFVSARVAQIARSVGAPVRSEADCGRANVEIMFTAVPQKLMDDVADRFPGLLGFPYQSSIRKLTAVTGAVQAWYATATRRRLGFASNWAVDRASEPDPSLITGTRLPPAIETALVNALIVADTSRLANRKLGSLADYIAMLVLSRANSMEGCDGLPTIFDLMSSACTSAGAAETLTAGDAAYLKGLYAADLSQPASAAIGDVAQRMYVEIEAEQSEPQAAP